MTLVSHWPFDPLLGHDPHFGKHCYGVPFCIPVSHSELSVTEFQLGVQLYFNSRYGLCWLRVGGRKSLKEPVAVASSPTKSTKKLSPRVKKHRRCSTTLQLPSGAETVSFRSCVKVYVLGPAPNLMMLLPSYLEPHIP